MTDNATENTVVEDTPPSDGLLITSAIYNRYGLLHMAVDSTHLVGLTNTHMSEVRTADEVTLVSMPGTPDWTNAMIRIRDLMARSSEASESEVARLQNHLNGLGEALLEEAIRRDWCDEYDRFAEEWDLPTRERDWTVFMTVRVKARTEEDAIDLVSNNVNISSYSTTGVWDDPEFTAEEN